MSDVIVFDKLNSPYPVLQYLRDIDDPAYNTRTDVILRPDLGQVQNQPQQYWKVTQWTDSYHGTVALMTTQEQAAVDAAASAAVTAQERTQAQSDLISDNDLGKLERAVADIIVNQLNLHTAWEAALASAVAGAATLAALKTAVAAITPVPSVTLAQAKTAILNDIAAGTEGD